MRASIIFPLLIMVLIGLLALTGCGSSSSSGNSGTGSGSEGGGNADAGGAPGMADPLAMAAETEAMGFIPSSKAGEHLGETGTVRGVVKDYQWISGRPKKPHLLLFDTGALIERGSSISDQEIPDTFTVVIWKEDALKNFPGSTNLGPTYEDKTVCVTGTIEKDFDDRPSITVTHPDQLKVDC